MLAYFNNTQSTHSPSVLTELREVPHQRTGRKLCVLGGAAPMPRWAAGRSGEHAASVDPPLCRPPSTPPIFGDTEWAVISSWKPNALNYLHAAFPRSIAKTTRISYMAMRNTFRHTVFSMAHTISLIRNKRSQFFWQLSAYKVPGEQRSTPDPTENTGDKVKAE